MYRKHLIVLLRSGKDVKQYINAIQYVLDNGENCSDRTGIGTRSVFGYTMQFDLKEGFPAVTTKKLAWKAVVGELLWFLEGSTDERRLAELTFGKPRTELVGKSTIWTANADAQGKALGYVNNDFTKELGPVYGAQWRNFNGQVCDQILWLIEQIKVNPDSRRLILSAWNPVQIAVMALPPCHTLAQFRVINKQLHCLLYQRSCDLGLGASFNHASYALLTHILAKECGLGVGTLIHSIGDAHIYINHIEQLKEQILRTPYPLPSLSISDEFDLIDRLNNGMRLEDSNLFTLDKYIHHPTIQMPMAI